MASIINSKIQFVVKVPRQRVWQLGISNGTPTQPANKASGSVKLGQPKPVAQLLG
jgi:hypothetical protein